jgi:hypothetical protein
MFSVFSMPGFEILSEASSYERLIAEAKRQGRRFSTKAA